MASNNEVAIFELKYYRKRRVLLTHSYIKLNPIPLEWVFGV